MDAVDGYQLNFSFNIRQMNVFKQNKLLSDPNMIDTMNKGMYGSIGWMTNFKAFLKNA